jgi:predicted RNase H-like HicB family nuclease
VQFSFCGEKVMHGLKYKVALLTSDDGFAAAVPGLPGCISQGRTEAEALYNIRLAIEEYLAAVDGDLNGATIREVEVAA